MKKHYIILIILSCIFSTSFAVNCIKPFGLYTTNITNTTVTLNWDPAATADSFVIRYYEFNTLNYNWKTISGMNGSTPVTSCDITGLSPGVKYSWAVRSNCITYPNLGYPFPADTFTTLSTPISCARPYALGASVITNTSALISWSPLVSADTFRVRYSVNGSNINYYRDVNAVGGGINSVTLTNLTVGTTYQVQVSSICLGISSGYSPSFIFTSGTTPIPCAKPFNLGTSSVTNFAATVTWTPYVTADIFRIRYSVNNTANYYYKDVSGLGGITNASLTNLLQNTTYQFQVSSLCTGVSSGYSNSFVFSTTNLPVPCATPYGGFTNGITTTTAVINWTPLVTADSFMVRYSMVSSPTNYSWKKILGGVTGTQLTGLVLNTQYQWQVRSICAGVVTSIYSPSTVFTTAPFRLRNPDIDKDAFEVFPNPANDHVSIRFYFEIETKGIIHLRDMLGKDLVSLSEDIQIGENIFDISTSGLSSGIYSLSLETDDFRVEKRLMVERGNY